ncbi:hypothetical protein R5M92_12615 [Halomonas sp. Bachu 37]|uniref:hypothetical protein n=1 Tax=Halomonas kashgarensis TaxID=3084920 RepID=UPI00321776B4
MNWKPIGIAGCCLWLAGCQMLPDRLPQAEPPPAQACRWSETVPAETILNTGVEVLTGWEFDLDSSDIPLGVITASRVRQRAGLYPGYDLYDRFGSGTHVFGGFGFGRGGGFSTGAMLEFGGRTGVEHEDRERVTVLVERGAENLVRVSRDIRRFDHFGDLRESRSASDAEFCQRLRDAMQAGMPQAPRQEDAS